MTSGALAIDAAYKRGDLAALKTLLGDPPDFPNCPGPPGVGEIILEYAIYHSPLDFIRELLELGADPDYADHAGFPSLIATLTCGDRADMHDVLKLLLEHGADVNQRGVNDYTALHHAAIQVRDAEAVAILLAHGANPALRTRIDDYTSPLEDAERLGLTEIARLLRGARPT